MACCIVFAQISATIVYAQYPLDPSKHLYQYNYEHWDSQNGLPDNAIIHLLQSKDEYIWFASYGGITRFNGVDFLTYSAFNTPELINNSFTYIYEDSDGVIWTASSGNGAVTVDNGELKIYTTTHGLPSNFVEEIVQDQSGRIWIATSDGLTYKKDDKFVNTEVPHLLKNLRIKSIDVDSANILWVATTNQGVYTTSNGQILDYYHTGNGLVSNNINYVKVENGNEVWIGTDAGLSIIQNGTITNLTSEEGLPSDMVSTSIIDKKGLRWIGTFRGMARRSIDDKWSYFDPSHPLFENDFTTLIQDTEGNLWIGTYRQGLYKLWDGKFTNYALASANDLQPFIVHCITPGLLSNTFIVINETGVYRLHPQDNRLERFDVDNDFSETKLKFGLVDSKGVLWVATQDYLLKYQNGKSVKYTVTDGLVHNNIRVIHEDSAGDLWIGTTNGISVIKPDGTINNYNVNQGLSHEYVMSIQSNEAGEVWIGTRNGLNLFKNDRFVTYYTKDGLAGEFVFKTFEDSDGTLWICGNAGLTRFKDGKFTIITSENGLASNTLFQILEDGDGYLWITTNQKNISVFKVHKDDLNAFADGKASGVKSIAYTQADGLKATSATSSGMSYKSADGRLWFATSNGVEMIDPSNIEINNKKPKVVIESFITSEKNYNLDSSVVVPSGKHRITITYAALSFIASENIEYLYKLEGYDDDWLKPEEERKTTYTNLPYGNYTFRVKAANSDGVWNEEGAALTFYVKPAFYQTKPFKFISIIGAIILAVVIYKLRIRSLERTQRDLGLMVEKRTKEVVRQKEEIEKQKQEIEQQQKQIQLKNDELQKINLNLEDIVEERTEQLKNAYNELVEVNKELDTFIYRSVHDVRGPLARLQGLSYLISLESLDGDMQNLVSRLNATADEMNEVFYSLLNVARLKAADLSIAQIKPQAIISKIENRLSTETTQVEVKLEVANDFELYTDEEILEVIFFHLIDNAVKYRRNGEQPDIKIDCSSLNGEQVSIRVSDKGRGIEEEVADKIFEMFYVGQLDIRGVGLGLYTVKTAVKVLNGTIRLLENARNEKHTTFEIRLPRAISHTNSDSLNSTIKSVPRPSSLS
nr:sensor histidine kinase [Fulvivirga aurantia]